MTRPGWVQLPSIELEYSDAYDTKRMVSATFGHTSGVGQSITEALEDLLVKLRRSANARLTQDLIDELG